MKLTTKTCIVVLLCHTVLFCSVISIFDVSCILYCVVNDIVLSFILYM
jgi:hypothetical protein